MGLKDIKVTLRQEPKHDRPCELCRHGESVHKSVGLFTPGKECKHCQCKFFR